MYDYVTVQVRAHSNLSSSALQHNSFMAYRSEQNTGLRQPLFRAFITSSQEIIHVAIGSLAYPLMKS